MSHTRQGNQDVDVALFRELLRLDGSAGAKHPSLQLYAVAHWLGTCKVLEERTGGHASHGWAHGTTCMTGA